MKVNRLLLTPEQHYMAWGSCAEISWRERLGKPDKRGVDGSSRAICHAQAAKVLAVLLREAKRSEQTYHAQRFLERIIRDTGLTSKAKKE